MSISHAFIGWCLVALSVLLFAILWNALRLRNVTTKRFVIDALLVLLFGAVSAVVTTALLLKFHHWGWAGLILIPALTMVVVAPLFLVGLFTGERLHPQLFKFNHAAASFLISTVITLLFAITFFKLINGPDGGSTGGWEFGFVALFMLCPLLWAGLFVGLYLISVSSTTREHINLGQP